MAAQRPDESFDVVNDNDEVIDALPRVTVHRLGLKHRAVHVLVFNSQGQVFLQNRSMLKDSAPGKWDSSASGHLASGENYDACAIRELQEELGLTLPQPPERLFKVNACSQTGQEFVWVYRSQSEGPFTLHPDEIEQGDWFDLARLDQLVRRESELFASSFLFIWQHCTSEQWLARDQDLNNSANNLSLDGEQPAN